MTDYIAKGLAEVLQPYSKNLCGSGPGVCVILNLKLWSGRRSLMSVAGRLCIVTSPLFRISTPWLSILYYPNYFLPHWSYFIALCIEET